jgi:hypothetical protein
VRIFKATHICVKEHHNLTVGESYYFLGNKVERENPRALVLDKHGESIVIDMVYYDEVLIPLSEHRENQINKILLD